MSTTVQTVHERHVALVDDQVMPARPPAPFEDRLARSACAMGARLAELIWKRPADGGPVALHIQCWWTMGGAETAVLYAVFWSRLIVSEQICSSDVPSPIRTILRWAVHAEGIPDLAEHPTFEEIVSKAHPMDAH